MRLFIMFVTAVCVLFLIKFTLKLGIDPRYSKERLDYGLLTAGYGVDKYILRNSRPTQDQLERNVQTREILWFWDAIG